MSYWPLKSFPTRLLASLWNTTKFPSAEISE
jgi:hypothetical protein